MDLLHVHDLSGIPLGLLLGLTACQRLVVPSGDAGKVEEGRRLEDLRCGALKGAWMLRFTNILCPVDFEQKSLAAVSVAAELAQEHKATVHLLHVLPLAIREAFSYAEMESGARTKLERIGHQKVKAGTRYELLVVTGEPAIEVLQAATRLGIDLIVMETHGRRGVRRLVLGSVAERVVRESPCPVLTIKPKTARSGASRKRPRP